MLTSDLETPEAWRTCYQALGPKLLLFARQWLPNSADAEDAVQAGFVRFWRKQPEAKSEHYPLLYAAVRSAALDLLRTNGRRAHREDAFHSESSGGEQSAPLFESAIENQERSEEVQRALQTIPDRQREVVVLRIWGELSFAEIAEATGESMNTAASRYRYGMEALRRVLQSKLTSYERV